MEMPILKAASKPIRNATIQVRLEEAVDLKLRNYAESIGSTPGGSGKDDYSACLKLPP
jgi:hypothetical protein